MELVADLLSRTATETITEITSADTRVALRSCSCSVASPSRRRVSTTVGLNEERAVHVSTVYCEVR